jgi:hypothetical protein
VIAPSISTSGHSPPVQVTLDQARIASSRRHRPRRRHGRGRSTLRPWQQPERNVRIAFSCRPASARATSAFSSLTPGRSTALCFSPVLHAHPADLAAVLAEARNQHPADRIYVSLLVPETQAEIHGQTLTSLPLSMANALEPLRNAQDAGLNGESAELAGEAPAGGVLSGFQILNLHIEPGGGLN